MKKQIKTYIDIEIDKLTKSIENAVSGDVFDTEIIRLTSKDTQQIKKSDWLFDWHGQLKSADRQTN